MSGHISKILRHIFSRKTMVFYEFSLKGFNHEAKSQNEYIYRQLTPDDYSQFSVLLTEQTNNETLFSPIFDIKEAAKRIKNGEFCFICEDKGEIVGYAWFAPKKKYILEIHSTIELVADEVYGYNGYVKGVYRGKNIISTLLAACHRELRREGFEKIIIAAMVWNRSVASALAKSGYNIIGYVSIGYFLTFRYWLNKCKNIKLVNEANPFEFYTKLFQKVRRLFNGL